MASCPNPRQLRRLLDEQLDPADEAWIVAHVEGCAKCQQWLDGLTEGSLAHPSWIPPLEELGLAGRRRPETTGPKTIPGPTLHHRPERPRRKIPGSISPTPPFSHPPATLRRPAGKRAGTRP